MIKGTIYVTNDMNMALSMAPTHTVICISSEAQQNVDFMTAVDGNIASILLPPPQASMLEMEGRFQEFKQLYFEHLSQKEPFDYICIILRAIFNGNNILLYLTQDESEMQYMSAFMEYMYTTFGVVIGSESGQFNIDYRYYNVILDTLYMNDLMDSGEFLFHYPTELQIQNTMIINKLIKDTNAFVTDTSTMEEFIVYFNNYKNSIKQNNIRVPIGGIKKCY